MKKKTQTNKQTNPGIRARELLAHGGNRVEALLPLNRYYFFDGFSDRLLLPKQLEFKIVLQA